MAEIVSRIYANFRGADFRGEEINLARSPDCLNVWKDYKETDSIRTRPGMEKRLAFDAPVYGIFFYAGRMIIHSGTKLYDGERVIFEGAAERTSDGFVYGETWYFKDGKNYLKYDGESVSAVVGFIPTTTIGRKPHGGGTKKEDINMLTGMRVNTFLADGESVEYSLDATEIDTDFVPVVTVDDVTVRKDTYTVDYREGKLTFLTPPSSPLTDGQDNVTVTFKKTVPGYTESILGCTLLQVFDNRVFFSGNPDHPNVVWHCSLDDPSYVSDLDYYREGLDTAQITGLVAGNNALWVFREPSEANTTVFYHTPTIDEEYGKIYPSAHSSVTIGCVGRAINFGDDIVFFSERGMEGISGDITTEQVVAHRSSLVDRKLTAEEGYKDMLLAEWEGYLLVFIGNKVYLADSRTAFTNENHIEYEWFYWELECRVISVAVRDGVLYLGTEDGVYMLTDTEADVESYWVTPKDKFNYPHKLKTTNKRGCVAEATGDISVYAKVEDTPFELIGTYRNVTDSFVSRIKRKKFKDIQLMFRSSTRFSLETVTLECFIGAYIKRVSSPETGDAGGGNQEEGVTPTYADGFRDGFFKGKEAGYADGHADAESADAIEDAALLDTINAAISATGAYAAETLDAVAGRIPEVYERAYAAGEKSQYIAEIKDGVLYVRTKTYARIENNVLYIKKENTV